MNPALIIQALQLLTSLAEHALDAYASGRSTLSEVDAGKIKAALSDSQQKTDAMRQHVDAVLDKAAQV